MGPGSSLAVPWGHTCSPDCELSSALAQGARGGCDGGHGPSALAIQGKGLVARTEVSSQEEPLRGSPGPNFSLPLRNCSSSLD